MDILDILRLWKPFSGRVSTTAIVASVSVGSPQAGRLVVGCAAGRLDVGTRNGSVQMGVSTGSAAIHTSMFTNRVV